MKSEKRFKTPRGWRIAPVKPKHAPVDVARLSALRQLAATIGEHKLHHVPESRAVMVALQKMRAQLQPPQEPMPIAARVQHAYAIWAPGASSPALVTSYYRGDVLHAIRAKIQQIRAHRRPTEQPGFSARIEALRAEQVHDIRNTPRKPWADTHFVGVEIECFVGFGHETVSRRLAEAGLTRYVRVCYDGSIRPDEGQGVEVCVVAPQEEITSVITRVCAVLRGLDARVNATCGLHVHLDMRSRDAEEAFSKLALAEDLLYSLQPASRRAKKYKYCKRLSQNAEQRRYRGINRESLHEHRTLELRMGAGTTDAIKINSWIGVLLSVIESPLPAVAPTRLSECVAVYGWGSDLYAWARERMTAVNPTSRWLKRVYRARAAVAAAQPSL